MHSSRLQTDWCSSHHDMSVPQLGIWYQLPTLEPDTPRKNMGPLRKWHHTPGRNMGPNRTSYLLMNRMTDTCFWKHHPIFWSEVKISYLFVLCLLSVVQTFSQISYLFALCLLSVVQTFSLISYLFALYLLSVVQTFSQISHSPD